MSDIPELFPRFLSPRIEEALTDTPVVLISGPRQSGKTTLARQFCVGRNYLALNYEPTLLAARADPARHPRSRPHGQARTRCRSAREFGQYRSRRSGENSFAPSRPRRLLKKKDPV